MVLQVASDCQVASKLEHMFPTTYMTTGLQAGSMRSQKQRLAR